MNSRAAGLCLSSPRSPPRTVSTEATAANALFLLAACLAVNVAASHPLHFPDCLPRFAILFTEELTGSAFWNAGCEFSYFLPDVVCCPSKSLQPRYHSERLFVETSSHGEVVVAISNTSEARGGVSGVVTRCSIDENSRELWGLG